MDETKRKFGLAKRLYGFHFLRFYDFCSSVTDGVKLFMIIFMIGAHHAIPYIKVETVIAVDIFMVHVMMRGSVVSLGVKARGKSFSENFETEVTANV